LALLDAQHPWWNFMAPNYRNLRLSRIVREHIEEWIERNFDTSSELRRKDPQLHAKNTQDKQEFKNNMEELRQLMLKSFQTKGRKGKEAGEAALQYFIGSVRPGSGLSNRIGSKEAYDTFCKQAAQHTQQLLEFEVQEGNAIEAMTFQLVSDRGGFSIDPMEMKTRRLHPSELPENLVQAPSPFPSEGLNESVVVHD
jgi:hypothetical protein